jgi:hypothetical protein
MRALAFAMLVACATTPALQAKGGPRGLRASEHMDVARRHDEMAHEQPNLPDPSTTYGYYDTAPWIRRSDASAKHERIADEHRSKAAAREAELLADMKCHRAWMMIAPANMEACPLDLPGIVLDAHGDTNGITVSIVVRDPKLVNELHARATRNLEAGAQLRKGLQ